MRQLAKDGANVVVFNYIMLLANYIFATLLLRAGFDFLYGHFIFINNLLNFIIIAFGLGLQMSLLRVEAPTDKFKELSFVAHILLQVFLLLSVFSYLWSQQFNSELIPIVVLSYVTTWMALVQPFFQWHEKMPEFQFFNMSLAVLKVFFCGFLFVSFISNLTTFWTLAGASVLYSIFSICRSGLFQIQSKLNCREVIQKLLKYRNWSLWISLISLAVYNRITVLTLPLMGFDATAIGNYGYSFSMLAAVLMLPGVLQMVLMRPLFSAKVKGSKLWSSVHIYYIVCGIFVSIFFSYVFPPVVNWAAGERPDLAGMLQAFSPSIPLVFVANLLGLSLLNNNHDRERTGIQVVAAITIVIALLILVPRYGLIGAAYATTISYFALYFGYVFYVIKHDSWQLRASRLPLILYGLFTFLAVKWPLAICLLVLLLPLFYFRRPVDTISL